MAFLMLGRTGEAEEVAQETFTELLLRWGSIDNPQGFVRTVAGDYLTDALQQLEPELREAVVLRYYLDHTVPEIAGIVGIPAGTVKSRLHHSLGRLSELLEE